MRIVDRKTFLLMPEGTVFSKFEPVIFSAPMIKGEHCGGFDFRFMGLADEVDCDSSEERYEILHEAVTAGRQFDLHFNTQSRDGLFDDDQLFAVWGRKDVEGLISRLGQALQEGYATESPQVKP